MMTQTVEQTEVESRIARRQLSDTASRIGQRLTPVNLVAEGAQALGNRAADALQDAKRLARKQPAAVIASAIALGAAFALKWKFMPKPHTPPNAPVIVVKPRRKLTIAKVANGIILAAQVAAALRGDKPAKK
jgi:broad specificity phosphatase PhoE